MVNGACRECGQAIGTTDAFCRRCGTSVSSPTDSLQLAPPSGLALDGVEVVDSPTSDGQRWQSTRTILGLGAVVLAVLIAMSALGGFGDSADIDRAGVNETASADTDDPDTDDADTDDPDTDDADTDDPDTNDADSAAATQTPEPTAEPDPPSTSTQVATARAPSPEDPDGPAASNDARDRTDETETETEIEPEPEPEQIIAGWDQVTEIYKGGGVVTVQSTRNDLHVIDLATGRWNKFDTPPATSSFQPTGAVSFPMKSGIVVLSGDGPELRPWDGSKSTSLGSVNDIVIATDDDNVIVGDENAIFFRPSEGGLIAHRPSTGESRMLEVPNGRYTMWRTFTSTEYPLPTDTGGGTAIWSFDDGWIDLGPGNAIAVGRQGALLEVCDVTTKASLVCIFEIVKLDGSRSAVHPSIADSSPFGTKLSTDLQWLAHFSANSESAQSETFFLTDLQTGTRVEAGQSRSGGQAGSGAWLGDSEVFVVIGKDQVMHFTDATTGEMVEIAEVPWTSRPSGSAGSATTFVDMAFPEPIASVE